MKRNDMDDDFGQLPDSAADDGGEGGALDYDQYYPTQLPLRPPEEEERAMLNLEPQADEADLEVGSGSLYVPFLYPFYTLNSIRVSGGTHMLRVVDGRWSWLTSFGKQECVANTQDFAAESGAHK